MKLQKFRDSLAKYKLPIFILISLSLLLLGGINFLSDTKKNSNTQTSEVIPSKEEISRLPAKTKSAKEKILEGKALVKGEDVSLYKDENYEIEYVPTAQIFFVKISKEPVEEFKKQSQDWFLQFGLAQGDLCTLPLRFFLEFELKNNHKNFSALPDGCSIPEQ